MSSRTNSSAPPRTGLVLSGGGARGAYQVGALCGLAELGLLEPGEAGIDVLVGASAGAINCGALAGYVDRLGEGVKRLERVWAGMKAQHIFRTDLRSLSGIGARWVRDLSFGGVFRHVTPKALLDNQPLRELLGRQVAFDRIEARIRDRQLHALAVTATDLYTTHGLVFVQGGPDLPLWTRGRWRVERTRIGIDHLMASSAIPIFFPTVELDGRHLGDGCIRNSAPLSPALNLGAERIVAVGVRRSDTGVPDPPRTPREPPSIAQITGTLFSVMLDSIEIDVEHSERVNRSVLRCSGTDPENPFRLVDVLWLSPSEDLVEIAGELLARLPRVVRYLLRGLGADESTLPLASYLLFDSAYTRRLIELGRRDVHAQEEEIRAFFAR